MREVLGNIVRSKILNIVQQDINDLADLGIKAKLAVVIVGNDPSSKVYVRSIEKLCLKMNLLFSLHQIDASTKEIELFNSIKTLNNDKSVHGILCQFPLPINFKNEIVTENISPFKDVDSISPANIAKWATGKYSFIPCTPYAVLEILGHYNIQTSGKEIIILGRSHTVGRPLSILLSNPTFNATVTLCHSKSENLQAITRRADILISAIGKANFVTESFLKKDCTIIDVGINYIEDNTHPQKGYVVGDVDLSSVKDFPCNLTPVPGGVGPVTISTLLLNTLKAARLQLTR